jgi:23S rRNA pseudoU1915 N3-methylase RlmH
MKYINPDEYIKRLATAQGIDVLNLVKSMQEQQASMQQQQAQAQQMELTKQAGQLASAPMMDPSKNPQAMEMMNGGAGEEGVAPPQE